MTRRSILQQPLIENLRWLRLLGDTIFLIGVASFAWFMAGLWFGWTLWKGVESGTFTCESL